MAGAVLYCFRRSRGVLLLAMLAHGFWDTSVFLPVNDDFALVATPIQIIAAVIPGIIALVVLRHDRDKAVTPEGVIAVADGTA